MKTFPHCEHDQKALEDAAKEVAGNWKKFDSFVWHDQPEDASLWMIINTSSRDSGILEESNSAAIEKELSPFFGKTVRPMRSSHWAVGYVDGYAIRVYRKDGKTITRAFKTLYELNCELQEYPLLDETDHSQREYDAALEAIGNACRCDLVNEPEDWKEKVFDWLWNNEQEELENVDDQGACPSSESIERACVALGYYKPEPEEEV